MQVKTFSQIIFLVAAISMSAGNTYSQDDSVKANNSLKDGMWALQFQIGGSFTLYSFQGGVVSIKRQFSERSAIRVGVSGTIQKDREENSSPDTAYGYYDWDDRDYQYITLVGQYLYYMNPESRVNVFLGGGPLVSFNRNGETEPHSNNTYSSVAYTNLSVGATGVFGVEWFILQELSVHAEYGITLQYMRYKRTIEDYSYSDDSVLRKSERVRNSWRFSGDSVKFGLSVYF